MAGMAWEIPVCSKEEGARRHALIRQEMQRREVDCLVVAGVQGNYGDRGGNFRYVANYAPWFDDEYIVFPLKGESLMLCWSGGHANWARRVSWIDRIEVGITNAGTVSKARGDGKDWALSRVSTSPKNYYEKLVEYITRLGYSKARIGICDLETMPAYVYMGLREGLPDAEFVDVAEMLAQIRMIKSTEEIRMVEGAVAAADAGFEAMYQAANIGVPENKVWAATEAAMTCAGAQPGSFAIFMSCPSLEAKGPGTPTAWSTRILQPGDMIFNEITPSYGGYFVHLCRPIVFGEKSAELKRVTDLHTELYHFVVRSIRPGVPINEIEDKVKEMAGAEGWSGAWAFQHQGLQIKDYLPADTILQPNMTFHIHPTGNYKGLYGGATLGNQIIVTDDGCRAPTRTEFKVFEKRR